MENSPDTFPSQEAEIRFIISLFLVLAVLLVASFVWGFRVERGMNSAPSQPARAFPRVEVEAKSAYVFDARTGEVLFKKDEDRRLSLASITKLMAALVASELAPQYGMVTVSREALAAYGDSGLLSEERWSLRDLLDFSLVSSSNDGIKAVALALGAMNDATATPEAIVADFVTRMNGKASELGLKNTYFWNETGLDESDVKGGAYGSAKDIALLLEHIIREEPELLEATRHVRTVIKSLDDNEHIARNTNGLAAAIPGLMASKTGFTGIAGGNLAFAFDPELGRPIIVVLLGSSEDGRFKDAGKLVAATMNYITQK